MQTTQTNRFLSVPVGVKREVVHIDSSLVSNFQFEILQKIVKSRSFDFASTDLSKRPQHSRNWFVFMYHTKDGQLRIVRIGWSRILGVI